MYLPTRSANNSRIGYRYRYLSWTFLRSGSLFGHQGPQLFIMPTMALPGVLDARSHTLAHKPEIERERECVCVCVCVHARLSVYLPRVMGCVRLMTFSPTSDRNLFTSLLRQPTIHAHDCIPSHYERQVIILWKPKLWG
jgi:hypothetical protein